MPGRNAVYVISTIALAFFLLSSCSVSKRRYSSGYHIAWKKHAAARTANVKKEHVAEKSQKELVVYASVKNTIEPESRLFQQRNYTPANTVVVHGHSKTTASANVSVQSSTRKLNFEKARQQALKKALFPGAETTAEKGILILVAILLMLSFLCPFAVLVLNGKTTGFRRNLRIWIATLLIFLIGLALIASASFAAAILGVILLYGAALMMIICFIHAIIAMVRGT